MVHSFTVNTQDDQLHKVWHHTFSNYTHAHVYHEPCLIILPCREPIKCGDVIRLQHLQTRLFLHSHFFQSPLSQNQEVSCFGDGTDTGGDESKQQRNILY